MEAALYNWICANNANGIHINGFIVRRYAKRVQNEASKICWLRSSSLHYSLTVGLRGFIHAMALGFVERTKRQRALMFLPSTSNPKIFEKIVMFAECDVCNVDEFGLFFRIWRT